MFSNYSQLSKELNKPVIVYYGINGHGRGLVDRMSSFGVKSPLRRAIVTDDCYYESADELVTFLKSLDRDNRYHYKLLDSKAF